MAAIFDLNRKAPPSSQARSHCFAAAAIRLALQDTGAHVAAPARN